MSDLGSIFLRLRPGPPTSDSNSSSSSIMFKLRPRKHQLAVKIFYFVTVDSNLGNQAKNFLLKRGSTKFSIILSSSLHKNVSNSTRLSLGFFFPYIFKEWTERRSSDFSWTDVGHRAKVFVVTALRASKHRSEDEHVNDEKETFLEKVTLYNQYYIHKCPETI